jgi:NADPH:quinone reductase-like Zn-dependent oxidoreductase
MRRRTGPEGKPSVLGYDAAGIIRAIGPEVAHFRPGDVVLYAGDITRHGTNAELHLVDERIVGLKPNRLPFAEAATVPLTAITAWKTLFDRLRIPRDGGDGADHLRCRRRRLHRGAARAAAHRPAPRRHGEPAGGGRLGPQHGGT